LPHYFAKSKRSNKQLLYFHISKNKLHYKRHLVTLFFNVCSSIAYCQPVLTFLQSIWSEITVVITEQHDGNFRAVRREKFGGVTDEVADGWGLGNGGGVPPPNRRGS